MIASRLKLSVAYAATIAAAVAVFLWIASIGERLSAPVSVAADPGPGHGTDVATLFHALLTLTVIVVVARIAGYLARLAGQPAVMGEIIGGIVLGSSLLGRVAPELYGQLLPPQVVPFLIIYSQLGIILYLFLVGVEFDLGIVRRYGHVTLAISHASIAVPMLFGAALALVLYPSLSTGNVSFTVFALFLGVSLSVTAFPVLARILTDLQINRSRMGTVALACAAIDDATAWCLLALVVGMSQTRAGAAFHTVGLTALFLVFVLTIGDRLVRQLLARVDAAPAVSPAAVSAVLLAMLLCALATEYIGIHAFFGAFLFGAIVPHRSRIAAQLKQRLEDVVTVLWLPAFFALTGMRTQIGLISGATSWLLCGLIILAACAGKFGGTVAASRLAGLTWRDSMGLGVLMNTRGLVELIVLNTALELHVISPTLFTMLVMMALVTTFMAPPLLGLLSRGDAWGESAQPVLERRTEVEAVAN